jgi:hypothetical protein
MEDWDKVLAAFGLKLVNIVIGAVASFVALNFWKGLDTRRERWMTFVGGWMLAAWGAQPLREWAEVKPSVEVFIVMLLGLFGMALAAEVVKIIRDTDWRGLVGKLVDAAVNRVSGGK